MPHRWSLIASQMEGRTDNDVKNHWNTKLKKRLLAAAAASSAPPPAPAPAPLSSTTLTSSLFPSLAIPTVKTEAYTCDDFLAPALGLGDPFAADGSTSAASAASSASNNWSAAAENGAGEASLFLLDFCAGPDLAAADQLHLPGGYYYPLDPSLSSSPRRYS